MIASVMLIDLDNLPSDPALLQRLLRDMAAAVALPDNAAKSAALEIGLYAPPVLVNAWFGSTPTFFG